MDWRGGSIQIGGQRELALVSMNSNLSRLKTGLLRSGRFFQLIQVALALAVVAVCLFGYTLGRYYVIFRDLESVLPSVQWMLLICLSAWCGCVLFLDFSLNDLPLIGLLLIAIAAYFISYTMVWRESEAIILLAGVMLGKGVRFLLNEECRMKNANCKNTLKIGNRKSEIEMFLVGLALLLAFSSWWHLDMANNSYHGPRWMGLWDNPNEYGVLVGAGVTLATGLLAQNLKSETNQKTESRKQKLLIRFLFVGGGMMGVGLVMSYSRGAWIGTAVSLLYLAKAHGKLKWRFVLPGVFVVAAVVFIFWHSTADTDPWYLKRLDLSRPSAQHRVAAWRGAIQIMRDHPLGVGWNKAVETYSKNYSPPEDGVAAITTNDYLMLGTQLGIPGLIFFVAYVGLALKAESQSHVTRHLSLQTACRAGAVMMLVAFWFDGGLFKLATASVFWILLELSQIRSLEGGVRNQTDLSLVPPSLRYGKTSTSAATK